MGSGKKRFKAPENWTFKTPGAAAAFDAHVREQLPWYEIATGAVLHIARSYVPESGKIVDVGASTGNIGRALAPLITARNALFLPIDNSPAMAKLYDGPGTLAIQDVTQLDFANIRPDLIVCFLSLMFVPVKERERLLRERMKRYLEPGGAIIVVDKIQPHGGYVGTVNYRLTLAAKYEAGAKPDEIIAKELSIAGVQRPMAAEELDGFVEFFRFGDFAGYVWERGHV